MSVDPQPLQIDERMAVAKLLKHCLLIRQAVVAEVAVAVAARTELSAQGHEAGVEREATGGRAHLWYHFDRSGWPPRLPSVTTITPNCASPCSDGLA